MHTFRLICLSFLLLNVFPGVGQTLVEKEEPLQTIAFGSCNNQSKFQIMWRFVLENDPNLWIWLGDNIYADTKDKKVMESKYRKLKENPEYMALRNHCPIIGTWDDHDYGLNDGGKEFVAKYQNQQLMLDFLDVPADAPVRLSPGVYQSFTYGDSPQQVKVILLDTRFFRDSLLIRGKGLSKNCLPNTTGDILGEAQWKWLEEELAQSTAQVNIICSSIQIIPDQHRFEKWANFPKAKLRLLELIRQIQPENLIFLSGDRHIAEVSRFDLDGLNYPLYEITGSGITHTWPEERKEENQYRKGDLIIKKNFALLKIRWTGNGPIVWTEIRGLGNELFLKKKLDWD